MKHTPHLFVILCLAGVLVLTACGGPQSGEEAQQQAEASPVFLEVTDADLEGLSEDLLVLPLAELPEHPELGTYFADESNWLLCHLMGTCSSNVTGHQVQLEGDFLTFGVPKRAATLSTDRYLYRCATNAHNNLLLCENQGGSGGAGGEMMAVSYADETLPEMTVLITAGTTFEIVRTDGRYTSEQSVGTRADLEALLAGTEAYSLAISHEEADGAWTATHIKVMIFPWQRLTP